MLLHQQYQEAVQELHEKEKYNAGVVKDHVDLKHMFEIEERAQQEENEAVRQ